MILGIGMVFGLLPKPTRSGADPTMTTRLASASTLLCLMAALSCQGSDSGSSPSPDQLILDSLVAFGKIYQQPGLNDRLVDYQEAYPTSDLPPPLFCEGGVSFPGLPGLANVLLGEPVPAPPFGEVQFTIGSEYLGCANLDSEALFSGTVSTAVEAGQPIATTAIYDFQSFGQCESLTGEIVLPSGNDGCSGQLTAICGGETILCNLGPDCESCL